MGSLNKVFLIGRLGKDPELRDAGASTVCNFTLATDERVKGADGQYESRPEWHRCTAWNKTADLVAKHLKKGSLVHVEGKLQTRKYEKDGQTHYATEVIVFLVQFLDSRKGDDSSPAQARDDFESPAGVDDDIPF